MASHSIRRRRETKIDSRSMRQCFSAVNSCSCAFEFKFRCALVQNTHSLTQKSHHIDGARHIRWQTAFISFNSGACKFKRKDKCRLDLHGRKFLIWCERARLVCDNDDDCIIYGILLWIWHPNRKKWQQTFHFMRPKRKDAALLACHRLCCRLRRGWLEAFDWTRIWNSKLNVISSNASFGVAIIIIRKSFLGIENNTHTRTGRS